MILLSPKRLGFALASTSALLYLGCAFVMMTVSQEAAVRFFNSMMHGVDVTSIIRWDMPWFEMVIGVLEVFILGWLIGATVAVLYNLGLVREAGRTEA
jgi:hypothetical protein